MGSRLKREDGRGLSRRDFLKVSAAGAAGAAAFGGWTFAEPAFAVQGMTEWNGTTGDYRTYHTTCPYCSASCGQVVAVKKGDAVIDGVAYKNDQVLDIWGDPDSPINQGGLCAKGAGAFQLATNARRIGAWKFSDISGNVGDPGYFGTAKEVLCYDDTLPYAADGVAWKRQGNNAWQPMSLSGAFAEIATGLKSARMDITPGATSGSNATQVQFFGCSHMNNEPNYLYRKIIANFGTSFTEHQARI